MAWCCSGVFAFLMASSVTPGGISCPNAVSRSASTAARNVKAVNRRILVFGSAYGLAEHPRREEAEAPAHRRDAGRRGSGGGGRRRGARTGRLGRQLHSAGAGVVHIWTARLQPSSGRPQMIAGVL